MSTLAVDAIQNAAGTSAATIGSNGEITTAHNLTSSGVITGNYLIDDNYPIFSGQGIAGFQSAGYEGVPSTIVCPSGYAMQINQAGLMGSDGAMIAPADGYYEYCVVSNSGTADGHRGLYVYQKTSSGTTNIDAVFTMNDYSGYTIASHRIIQMSQGDKILWGYHNSYVQWNQSATTFNCWGRRIK